jgi:hypothetical protein
MNETLTNIVAVIFACGLLYMVYQGYLWWRRKP